MNNLSQHKWSNFTYNRCCGGLLLLIKQVLNIQWHSSGVKTIFTTGMPCDVNSKRSWMPPENQKPEDPYWISLIAYAMLLGIVVLLLFDLYCWFIYWLNISWYHALLTGNSCKGVKMKTVVMSDGTSILGRAAAKKFQQTSGIQVIMGGCGRRPAGC